MSPSEAVFAISPITTNDVILAVAHLKSLGRVDDGIPQSVIANALFFISPYLNHLFNTSFKKETFPSTWKKALNLALKNVVVPSSPSDFRPIALLCLLLRS